MEAIHSQTVIVGIPFGNDQVSIPFGNDKVSIPCGNDQVSIPFGNDQVSIPFGNDQVSIPCGNDQVSIPFGNDQINIPFGNDQVSIYSKILSFNILKPTYNDGDNVTKIFSRNIQVMVSLYYTHSTHSYLCVMTSIVVSKNKSNHF
jgi:hypothetical protein